MNNKIASIIIISFNKFHDTTEPCLKSVFEHTDYPDYEVIVVDNNSTDGTPENLKVWAAKEPRLKCIFNTINRGFAGGNNDAVKVANGRFLILLNSDTRVSKGWLNRIITVLETDSSVGLVGPVSNSTGNEQTIFSTGGTTNEILDEGIQWASMSSGDIVPMERLCFFCVATRRDVVDRVGLLDEAYGVGFYEDDDYCLRVRNVGYRLVCCEDVFVYHQGGASFGKASRSTKALLTNNKKLLERKFGLANYHVKHPRDRQLALVESYIEQMRKSGSEEKMRYKITNRLCLLKSLTPHGILKRIRFYWRLHGLKKNFQECLAEKGWS